MSGVRDSRWPEWLLLGAVVVAVFTALFFLNRNVSPSLPADAASSVSNAPG
jgi:hypothetical protein